MVKLKLTKKEKNAVVKELAERMKDVVYMNAEEKAESAVNELLELDLSPDSSININYKITFLLNDILQILGRIKRQKRGDEKNEKKIKQKNQEKY